MNPKQEELLIKKIIILGLILFLLFISARLATSTTMYLPSQRTRHYLYQPSFWQRLKSPKFFAVRSKARNNTDRPKDILARAAIVTLDNEGKIKYTKEFLRVEPSETTVYPGQEATFKILFPIPSEDSSQLAVFTIMPQPKKGAGVHISTGTGFLLAASFAVNNKWNPDPIFSASKKNGKIICSVTNQSQWALEARIYAMKGDERDEQPHFYLESNKSRQFEIPNNGYDAVVLDVGGYSRLIGLRLR